MLKEYQYHKLAEEYQTNVGVMEWEGNSIYPYYPNVRKMPDEFKVIVLTNHIIKEGLYQQMIREVIRLEAKYGKRNIKKSTIYEKAIDNII